MAGEIEGWMKEAAEEALAEKYVTACVVMADNSLHPARRSLWHQMDRRKGCFSEKLRGMDCDSRWDSSPYHNLVGKL
jgi:hypothetical protein